MEDKIKKLKDLRLAYKAALEYDYCPDGEAAENLIENYFEVIDEGTSLEDLKIILDTHQGSSPDNLVNDMLRIIKQL